MKSPGLQPGAFHSCGLLLIGVGAQVLEHGVEAVGVQVYAVAVAVVLAQAAVLGLEHAAAEDVLGEDHIFLLVLGLELYPDVAELAVTAGLLLVAAVGLERLADLLAVGDAGGGELDLDAELVLQLGAEDVEMDVAARPWATLSSWPFVLGAMAME